MKFCLNQCVVLAAVLLLFVLPVHAEKPQGKINSFHGPVGLQTYSLRNHIPKDWRSAFEFMKKQGFKEVEIGLENHYGMTREELKAALEEYGLTAISAHAGLHFLMNNTDKAVEEANYFGLKYLGIAMAPYKKPFDETQALKLAEDMNTVGKKLKEKGIQFFYHNHGYEFHPYKDGETLFDLLVQKTNPEYVEFQMDVLWVIFPGQDPVALLKKYPGRWSLMHLKDLAIGVEGNMSGTTAKDNDVTLGMGQVDYPALLKAAQEVGVKHYFIEDESSHVLEQVPLSLEFLLP